MNIASLQLFPFYTIDQYSCAMGRSGAIIEVYMDPRTYFIRCATCRRHQSTSSGASMDQR